MLTIDKIQEMSGFVPPPTSFYLSSVGEIQFTALSAGDLERLAKAAEHFGVSEKLNVIRSLMVAVGRSGASGLSLESAEAFTPEEIHQFSDRYISHIGISATQGDSAQHAADEVRKTISIYHRMVDELQSTREQLLIKAASLDERVKKRQLLLNNAAKIARILNAIAKLVELFPLAT